jgi:hypothetical protein
MMANAELTASDQGTTPTAVCEIDQATADQFGIVATGG